MAHSGSVHVLLPVRLRAGRGGIGLAARGVGQAAQPVAREVERCQRRVDLDALRDHDGRQPIPTYLASTDVTPHDILENKELRHSILEALNSLSERHRTVVVLFDIEGLSHRQIAEILQCPEGTVMSRLHHGRLKLKHILSKRLNGYFQQY